MIPVQEAISQLDKLLDNYKVLRAQISASSPANRPLEVRLQAAIERFSPAGSVYAKDVAFAGNHYDKLGELVSLATALREDLEAGWLESIVSLVHADTFSNFLEVAEELLAKGYKDAAAVIIGSSLEVHIRALCLKNNVITDANGKPKRADVMNADLKKSGAYGALEQKQVTTWLDLRNSAAHGNYENYDEADVKHFINGVQSFMVKYPA
jgi:hypothetical protein